METEICKGCRVWKPITDVFDGTLCEDCRLVRGLLRPEDAAETAPWADEFALRRIRELAGPLSVN